MVATIEFIENVIATFEQATAANARTDSREGNLIELKKDWADDVMISADLHGNRPNFNKIRNIADLKNHPKRHLIIQEVCHGGPVYPNTGGCMSHMMLEDVARLKVQFPDQVHFLLSNHELAELTDYPILKNQKMLNLLFRFGMQEMYGSAADNVRQAMLPFIRTLPLAVRVEHGIWISHTIPERCDQRGFDEKLLDVELGPNDVGEGTPVFEFVWGRDFRQENADAFAKKVEANVMIHGHEPCPQGFDTPNSRQIIIDSHAENARYIILPVGERLSQDDVVQRIKKLF
ncbi:MAG: metallophosphoesterase [Planctomycetota bacterium]|nr:metallophosphoesterase [Planctomycetota bacterium]MEE3220136.1 metallophosphoesterase [Planctomycetota bacterium]